MVEDHGQVIRRPEQENRVDEVDSDVGTLAGIVHLLYFAQWVGLIIAIVLWATRGQRNRFLAFQCAQAIIIQGGMFIVLMVFAVVYGIFMMLSFVLSVSAAGAGHDGPAWPFVVGFPIAWGLILLFWLVYLAVGGVSIWVAVRCFQDREPWIPGVGTLAARLTGYHRD